MRAARHLGDPCQIVKPGPRGSSRTRLGLSNTSKPLVPEGSYGQWPRSKPVAVVVDATVFLHGGLSGEHDAASVNEMNDRAVVGHTVTPSRRIEARFDDRVFLIDTGMLSDVYQGRASALEFSDSGATAIYVDDRVPLTGKNW